MQSRTEFVIQYVLSTVQGFAGSKSTHIDTLGIIEDAEVAYEAIQAVEIRQAAMEPKVKRKDQAS